MARLIAEWEPQDGVLLTWPHEGSDWRRLLPQVETLYRQLVQLLARYGQVVIAAPSERRAEIEQTLLRSGVAGERLRVYAVAGNDTWARDHGPITVDSDGELLLLDFRFNGWGNKFPSALDNAITGELYRQGAFPGARLLARDLILEGGAIESDGRGTLLTTEQCLLNPNRNPQLGREQIELILQQEFGVSKILWLRHGYLAGDDTDSHIDTLARLCPDNVIVHVACDDPADEHFEELQAMARELAEFRSADGRPYRLVPLPWPRPLCSAEGERLPATYANFLIINGAVLVPTYGDSADAVALESIAAAFPGYTVEGLDCRVLIEQHGSLHCITMQLPRGVLAP